jgi:hypothetical protein
MRYLITTDSYPPFLTKSFEVEDNFIEKDNMEVYDLEERKFTVDGKTWTEIKEYNF